MARSGAHDRVVEAGVLLCERCGYVLEGTAQEGVCAECGKAVVESLAERRVGSVWQQRAGWRTLARVAWMMHTRPSQVWKSLAISRADVLLCRNGGLMLGAIAACAVLIAWVLRLQVGGVVIEWNMLARMRTGSTWGMFLEAMPLLLAGAVWVAIGLGCLVLTWIEVRGVMFFSARRGWRVPKNLAWAICAHASVTWWVAAVGVVLGLVLSSWVDGRFPPGAVGTAGAQRPLLQTWIRDVSAVAPLVGFGLGMLVFETLVYQGVRVCKFANVREVKADKERGEG